MQLEKFSENSGTEYKELSDSKNFLKISKVLTKNCQKIVYVLIVRKFNRCPEGVHSRKTRPENVYECFYKVFL